MPLTERFLWRISKTPEQDIEDRKGSKEEIEKLVNEYG